MASSEIEGLRKLARQRQRAASQKISRYRRQGIDIARSEHDPRRELKRVDRYNAKQLKSYISKLDSFTDRSNQFVRGARGVAISRGVFEAYKALEKRYNSHFKSEFERIRDVKMPGKELTFGERHEMILPKAKSLRAGTSKYFGKDRVSSGFPSDAAVKKAMSDIKRKTRSGHTPEEEKGRRANFEKLLAFANRDDVLEEVRGLTSEEFYILWEYDSVIQNVVEEYYIVTELLAEEDNAIEHSGGNALFDEILQTVKEVKSEKNLRGRLRNNNKRK